MRLHEIESGKLVLPVKLSNSKDKILLDFLEKSAKYFQLSEVPKEFKKKTSRS